jgi:uncharacterized protein YqhQ
VMMKSPSFIATSVRKTSGEIVSKVEPYVSLSKRKKVLGVPVIRGAVNLFEQLYLGIKSLTFSAEVVSSGEEEIKEQKSWKSSLTAGLTVLVALGVGLLLFFYLPLVIANHVGIKGSVLFNVVDGAVRLTIFFAYLAVLNMWKEMRRVFEYHGAEHKSIHAFESGESLNVENVKRHTTRHARCGTSFLLVVMVISIIVFIIMGRPDNIRERLLRLCAVPLIAGVSYEIIKLAGKRSGGVLMKIITTPGLALQRFTTREPSDDQIEVALDALKNALGPEGTA